MKFADICGASTRLCCIYKESGCVSVTLLTLIDYSHDFRLTVALKNWFQTYLTSCKPTSSHCLSICYQKTLLLCVYIIIYYIILFYCYIIIRCIIYFTLHRKLDSSKILIQSSCRQVIPFLTCSQTSILVILICNIITIILDIR